MTTTHHHRQRRPATAQEHPHDYPASHPAPARHPHPQLFLTTVAGTLEPEEGAVNHAIQAMHAMLWRKEREAAAETGQYCHYLIVRPVNPLNMPAPARQPRSPPPSTATTSSPAHGPTRNPPDPPTTLPAPDGKDRQAPRAATSRQARHFTGSVTIIDLSGDRNRSWLGKKMTQLGIAGYPAMRIVALAGTGTRGLLGAVIGGQRERSEVPLARKLIPLLREGMLLLSSTSSASSNGRQRVSSPR
jgi:hypothetical protein